MALHLNLLHEQIAEHRQRQRDPLKIGMLVLSAIGAIMLLFYMSRAYQTLAIKNRANALQREWAKVEPTVTNAQKRSKELTGIINTTKVLDTMMEGRFYWGPLLQKLSRCVAPNAQLTTIDGLVNDETKVVTLTIDGIAAGREPRAAAEELRQLLIEQLSQTYTDVKVEFKTLEDLDTLVNVGGAN
jgi:Tfp pilus assembly protein PilN